MNDFLGICLLALALGALVVGMWVSALAPDQPELYTFTCYDRAGVETYSTTGEGWLLSMSGGVIHNETKHTTYTPGPGEECVKRKVQP